MQGARIRIVRIDPKHGLREKAGHWLKDEQLPQALEVFRDIEEEEPGQGWVLQCCGDVGNWHNIDLASVPSQFLPR